mmetsp:Transcript_5054/g.7019  ORF Transcript_5054/g.7019 Transcript_5054/m.7019 type:complete len:80 (-) Transcript_5054:42-281(-)
MHPEEARGAKLMQSTIRSEMPSSNLNDGKISRCGLKQTQLTQTVLVLSRDACFPQDVRDSYQTRDVRFFQQKADNTSLV